MVPLEPVATYIRIHGYAAFVAAVEAAQTFEALPETLQTLILEAERRAGARVDPETGFWRP
ncbi:gsl4148 [Gloeobacter violaceus PCC 7421]|uniref:Gsl4148 protein n=1 Tax=Gloeobacter violaceus (strain ATCC 29082 / PCC 7421) TaxID=251221 RepID=Q7NDT4_GLOVI|nr:gsl4148 [Gloeobacter violaceus PCC 7421]